MKHKPNDKGKAWVVAVDMGYGHQRTAYPLRSIAPHNKVINANHYKGIPYKDKRFWEMTRSSYEFISRFRRVPFLGEKVFAIFDHFQKIMDYYPLRDLSRIGWNQRVIFYFIKKLWGRDLIARLSKRPLPFISTFFSPTFMAEEFGYQNHIYCVICDADIARAWVSLDPRKSRITYFAPCTWVRDRLKLYGVRSENIIFTGYPLPKENIGGRNMTILKKDLRYRLLNLDPHQQYRKVYSPLLKGYLGELPEAPNHPLTILFSIGGAGAQKEIVVQMVMSLREKILAKELRVVISVGVKHELKTYFEHHLKGIEIDGWAHVLFGKTMDEYFKKFNEALRTTDILWTKPSELSFYTGLGIPIIIAPPLGSQEDFNKRWLLHIGAGTPQENPRYIKEWLFDLLEAGDFAEMAMQGFVEVKSLGTYNIEKIISEKHG